LFEKLKNKEKESKVWKVRDGSEPVNASVVTL
jgi:hypothetical protein